MMDAIHQGASADFVGDDQERVAGWAVRRRDDDEAFRPEVVVDGVGGGVAGLQPWVLVIGEAGVGRIRNVGQAVGARRDVWENKGGLGAAVFAVANFEYAVFHGIEMMGGIGTVIFSVVIWVITIGLFFYARWMTQRGVLR